MKEQQQQQNSQFRSTFKEFNQKVVFKIFGFSQFSYEKAYSKSIVDWSGFYTQMNPQHSMRYLTKKWDDGSNFACLVILKPINSQLKILQIQHPFLSNPKIKGQQKANLIKNYLKQKYQIQLSKKDILVDTLGKKNILLKCIDSQDPEIIIPHQLLNQNNFVFKTMIQFKKSQDSLLRTIGWKKFQQKLQCSIEQLPFQYWNKVQSECQYEPYLLLKLEQIQKTIQMCKQQLLNN